MSDSASTHAAKTPALVAYHVRLTKSDDALWTRIGAAWPHADGQGFNIQIDVVPLDGRICLRPFKEKA